jgi:cytochrome c peroxidase
LLLIGLAHQAGSAPAMPVMPIPADNLQNPAKIALGQRLFYEKRLSGDGSMACATCHQQARGFADGVAKHPGIHGEPGNVTRWRWPMLAGLRI